MILAGKRRITDALLDVLCEQMFYAPEEKDYFQHLVTYSQSRSSHKKRRAGQYLTTALKWRLETYDIAANPLIPRVYSVLDQDKVDRSLGGP